MKLFLDFDGTLVNENSSEIFENVLYSYSKGIKKIFLKFFFFTKISFFSKIFFIILGKVFYKKRDLKLLFFIKIFKKELQSQSQEIIQDTIHKLSFNIDVLNYIKSNNFVVISNGLGLIIEELLKNKNLGVEVIYASQLNISCDSFDIVLKNFDSKKQVLKNISSFEYITDDYNEAVFLQNGIKGITISKLNNLYILIKQ